MKRLIETLDPVPYEKASPEERIAMSFKEKVESRNDFRRKLHLEIWNDPGSHIKLLRFIKKMLVLGSKPEEVEEMIEHIIKYHPGYQYLLEGENKEVLKRWEGVGYRHYLGSKSALMEFVRERCYGRHLEGAINAFDMVKTVSVD